MSDSEDSYDPIEYLQRLQPSNEDLLEQSSGMECSNSVKHVPVKWSDSEIKLLIVKYSEHYNKLDSPQYNATQVWGIIAKDLQKYGVFKSSKKCHEKWRNLKKTYEKFKKYNSNTGSSKKFWKYYNALHDIYFKNPSVHPLSTISSTGKENIRSNNEEAAQSTRKDTPSSSNNNSISNNQEASQSSCNTTPSISLDNINEMPKKKRKQLSSKEKEENAKERRHRERLQQKERMFEQFMKAISKKTKED